MFCLPDFGAGGMAWRLCGVETSGGRSMPLHLGFLPVASPASVAEWIVAISGVITALATLGAFCVALWVALESRRLSAVRRTATVDGLPEMMGVLLVLLRLLAADEAQRYRNEWGAHLQMLEQDGEHEEVRRARRSFTRRVALMAVELRLRRIHSVLRRRLNR